MTSTRPISLYNKNDNKRQVLDFSIAKKLPESYRTEWRRDYARLLHSAAFRRLQGKTQLFPSQESDFFRNRLTHSLEVAQVAKSIAVRINNTHPYFKDNPINLDLVEFAALAHDLGHPPFGHNGEEALDERMCDAGGFEGNAQTLRILAKLEKRGLLSDDVAASQPVVRGQDVRAGLNLTYRSLAAVLKYDRKIPLLRKQRKNKIGAMKGYYQNEGDLVQNIKDAVGVVGSREFRTIECSIMDIADDIAYSTYDLEDAFKARFLTPLSMLAVSDTVAERVAQEVSKRLTKNYPLKNNKKRTFTKEDVYKYIFETFKDSLAIDASRLFEAVTAGKADPAAASAAIAAYATEEAVRAASVGYIRTRITSELVGKFISSVEVDFCAERPALSTVYLDIETFKTVEVLKNFVYQSLIMSPMLKVAEHRGKDIIHKIFDAISNEEINEYMLMPEDFQKIYSDLDDDVEKKRVICDFIAGMTDRYAIQFYARLFGASAESIYAPL